MYYNKGDWTNCRDYAINSIVEWRKARALLEPLRGASYNSNQTCIYYNEHDWINYGIML